MARFILLTLCVALFSFSTQAQTGFGDDDHLYTKDPNHDGSFSRVYPMKWIPYESPCKKCKTLTDAYNKSMQDLMHARHHLTNLKDDLKDDLDNEGDLKKGIERRMENLAKKAGKERIEGLEEGMLDNIVAVTEYREELKEIKKNNVPALEQAIKNLKQSTDALREQITECEKQCETSETDKTLGALGTPPSHKDVQLPFDWKGPYPPVCENCAKLATRLNNLPGAALVNLAELDAAEANKAAAEAKIKNLGAGAGAWQRDSESVKSLQKILRQYEKELKTAEKAVRDAQIIYERLKRDFKETLALYDDCVKKCKPKSAEPAKQACTFSDDYPSIAIGPNSEFGSGAALTDKIESQAKGAAMGALNSVLGGSGISLGGGGGKSQQPKEERDPTSGQFVTLTPSGGGNAGDWGGLELSGRATIADVSGDTAELNVSTDIKDSPGDGTFHAQWIEGADGKIYKPVRYFIIQLYRDWKLTVWWDYKRWQDNKLVQHDHGEEVTIGRDYYTFIQRLEGAGEAIWNALGFGTAKKGVQHLGSEFQLPVSALTGPCPARLVTHISKPDEDPVTTIPVVSEVRKAADSNAIFLSPTKSSSKPSNRTSKRSECPPEGQTGYLISNNARIVDERRNLGARTVASLSLNQKVEVLEGNIGDSDWIKVRTADCKEGYIRGTTLRNDPLENVPGHMSPHNGHQNSESVGIGAKG